MAVSATHAVLQSFQNNVEDIRNLASCKICLRPFYEPFILSCGHTFCYGCLRNWVCGGDSRKKNKSCPECRASIREQPAPNYALRDLAHMFTDRAELLPADETLEEHKRGKVEESRLLANDRAGSGLFDNIFNRYSGLYHMRRSIWDASDGVQRCPQCNWELENGFCNHCGHDAFEDRSDEDLSEDDVDDDGDSFSNDSDVLIDLPDEAHLMAGNDGLPLPYPHPPTDDDDDDETNTDTDPYPWGFRRSNFAHDLHDGYGETDEDDEDDNWEDYSDSMGQFIDDSRMQDQRYWDATGTDLSTVLERHAFHRAYDHADGVVSEDYEDDYSESMDSDGISMSPTDDDSSTINGDYEHHESDDQANEDSEEDRASTPVQHSIPKRRGHVIISDDDDDDDEHDADQFEDTVTDQESDLQTALVASANISRHEISGRRESYANDDVDDCDNDSDGNDDHDEDDDGEDDDDHDGDEDDEPIRSAHGTRGRSGQPPVETARRGDYRGSQGQRGSRSGTSTIRGYHPYARPRASRQSGNRYTNSGAERKTNSRAAIVY